ncbi:class I SAM-dependent methyltransferase [Microbulbifer harenosus]|uniref:Methyltransferase domain-containing protein n=1 Tax=Microbulbifer harenosus TaxID=2576840 RepID=A0ABY2UL09_9GAMM|nr:MULTISPECIES: methyltransferase domain-containing protein [Microbulbifer]QIL89036.1 methyltransferase domain-containing protein [Microbulbifer sp. SH-1]TLM77769.1 methyltransferase domain-containing protein [Microbulbifer harenosus]
MAENNSLSRQMFGLTVRKNAHPDMRRLRREAGDASLHGNKFWKSSCLTMDYLTKNPLIKGARVLDLGCGWGLGGIFCAKAFDAKVTSLDADPSVFPFAEYHAALNGVEIKTWHCRYEKVTQAALAEFDAVIGTDICFWDKLEAPLFNLTRRALRAGVDRIVLVDPGRPPFRQLAERAVEKLDAGYFEWQTQRPIKATGCILHACA